MVAIRNKGKLVKGGVSNENHPMWRGDSVGHSAMLAWVRRNLGNAKKCEECGTESAKKYGWASISRKHKRDLSDWRQLCISCHRKYYARVKIKKCRVCKIILSDKNTYTYQDYLMCKKCKGKYWADYRKRYSAKNKEKWIARAKVSYAVKSGILKRPTRCEVCDRTIPVQGHHEDYSKPLEVIWLCPICHKEADKEKKKREKGSNLLL